MSEFIPKKQEKTVISIRISTETLDTVDSIAVDSNLSRNEFIVQCIEFAINNYNKST